MSERGPIECCWDGDVFRPTTAYWARRAAREYAAGEIVRMADQPERSSASHQHYFASVTEAWRNLPPLMAERYPTADHLRRYALIKAGYCNSQSMPCGTPEAARRFAAFIKPLDGFAVVTVQGSVVSVFTAKSQSYKAMSKKEFHESKDAVLGIVADMIEVSKRELSDNAGRAA